MIRRINSIVENIDRVLNGKEPMIGEDITMACQILGMTYKEMAAYIGVSRITLMNWRQGRHKIPKSVEHMIRHKLGNTNESE